ncbi:hypothetical protein IMG5_031020 [Ichthyophthirius multifiliis]|uniref:PAS domain S-box family protein n=1 Tax=Ichthyophthirius multifiliis TaxID=5932 RepID=G0QLI4_ICHMU|nr:hypothetical protein IMG5_031020 [Ichthyophthirius multifiliis]EGR33918.1 hypothetical protein IMG5_031020 [Ichthyophthirius multifiliis]|eukprot:XP_004039222.1 hypothetical protein IMG5_031020 [Ichthyophthirius multifiliis]
MDNQFKNYTKTLSIQVFYFKHKKKEKKTKNNIHKNKKDQNLFKILDSLKYFDIIFLIKLSKEVYQISIIVTIAYIIIMNLLYTICLIHKYFNVKAKPRKFFFGRWFSYFQSFYQFLFFYPFIVILMSYVFCNQEIFTQIDMTCDYNDSFYIITFTFTILALFSAILNECWLALFYQNMKQYKKDQLSIDKYPQFQLYFSVLKIIIGFFRSISIQNSYYFLLFQIILQIIVSSFIYYELSFKLGFYNLGNQNIKIIFFYSYTILYSTFLSQFTDEIQRKSEIFGQGTELFLYLTIFYSIILITLSEKIRDFHHKSLLLNKSTNLFLQKEYSQKNFLLQIQILQDLTHENIQQNDTIFKGLINSHLNNPCEDFYEQEFKCFCKLKSLYDPKKHKDVKIEKVYNKQNSSIFTKFIIKRWFELYLLKNRYQQYHFYIYYAEFLYFKFKNIALALKNLCLIQEKYLNPLESFHLFQLKHIIIKQNRSLNRQSYQQNLESQSVIPVETQMVEIQKRIKFILKNNVQFWAYLAKNTIDLYEINKKIKQSFHQIKQLKQIWQKQMQYLYYRKKWVFYYAWYQLFILNKKVKLFILEKFQSTKINENDIFSEELQNDDIFLEKYDIESVDSNLRPENYDIIQIKKPQMVFDMNSVVLHVDNDFKCNILKTNRALFHTFGYLSNEVENKVGLDKFMPRIFGKIHEQQMKEFTLSGKSKCLYSQRKVFCMNKQGDIFQSYKYVKQFVTLQGNCEYIALIRPIKSPQGLKQLFLILNENWEIDCMSDIIYQALGINPLTYQNEKSKQILNFLLVSPSLLQYTKYIQYTTNIDQYLFQKINEETGDNSQKQEENSENVLSPQSCYQKQEQIQKYSLFQTNSIRQQSYFKNELSPHSSHIQIQQKFFQAQQTPYNISIQIPQEIPSQMNYEKNKIQINIKENNNIIYEQEENEQLNEHKNFQMAGRIKKLLNIKIHKSRRQTIQQELNDLSKSYSLNSHDNTPLIYRQQKIKKENYLFFNDKLDKGEDVDFDIIIPDNLNQMMLNYFNQIQKIQITQIDDVDKQIYEIIKQIISNNNNNIKTINTKNYKCNCTLKMIQYNKQKVIIIKLNKFEKQLKKKIKLFKNYVKENSIQKCAFKIKKKNDALQKDLLFIQNQPNQNSNSNSNSNSLNLFDSNQNKENILIFNKTRGYQTHFDNHENNNSLTSVSSARLFQKDFQNRQGSMNFNLNHTENIYIKEDNHKSNKKIIIIQSFAIFVRIFFIFLIFMNIFTFFYGPYQQFSNLHLNAEGIFQSKKVTLTILQSYNTILDLLLLNTDTFQFQNNKYWTKTTYQNMKIDQLKVYYDYFKQILYNEQFSHNLYNQDTTPFSFIKLPIGNTQYTYTLDSFDFMAGLIYNIQTVCLQKDITILKINQQEIAFIRQNIFPFIYNQLQSQQENLINDVNLTSKKINELLILVIIIQSILTLISFLVLFRYIMIVCNTFQSILEVLPKIDSIDILKIKNYSLNLLSNFKYITNKDDLLSGTIFNSKINFQKRKSFKLQKTCFMDNYEVPIVIQTGAAKKQKEINYGKFLRSTRIQTTLYYTLFIFSITAICSYFLFSIISSSNTLFDILDNGMLFMKNFDQNIIIMSAIKEKILDKNRYVEYLLPKINSNIQEFLNKNQIPYSQQINDCQFDEFFQNIYYKNPCILYGDLIPNYQQECENVAQQSFMKGVSTFNAFYQNTVGDFVNNKKDSILSNQTILDYDRGVFFYDVFIIYLIEIWGQDMKNYLNKKILFLSIFLGVIVFLIILAHIVINEKLLIGNLQKEYAYFRCIYKMYMPDEIILKEKRIKFWLVKHYVLNK